MMKKRTNMILFFVKDEMSTKDFLKKEDDSSIKVMIMII